jgi:hypothetical protein
MFGWLSDSSGWIVLSSQNTYKLFKTSSQEPVLLPTKLNLKQPGVNLGATSAGTYVSADWSPYTTTDIKIKETDLSTGKLVNAFSIPSPGGDLLGPLMSPDGHRLLWHMGRGIHEGPLGWFHSFMMALRSGAETQTIWVSNLDGTSMRILGSVDVNSDTGFYAQFIPDGKSLSFTYNGWLWTAPID